MKTAGLQHTLYVLFFGRGRVHPHGFWVLGFLGCHSSLAHQDVQLGFPYFSSLGIIDNLHQFYSILPDPLSVIFGTASAEYVKMFALLYLVGEACDLSTCLGTASSTEGVGRRVRWSGKSGWVVQIFGRWH